MVGLDSVGVWEGGESGFLILPSGETKYSKVFPFKLSLFSLLPEIHPLNHISPSGSSLPLALPAQTEIIFSKIPLFIWFLRD